MPKILDRKTYYIILAVAILILIAVGVWIGRQWSNTGANGEVSDISAVYLSTGDIYFGQLTWFPWPRLKSVWYLDRSVDPKTNEPRINLSPLRGTFWGPVDELRLNSKEIVFTARLRSDSQVVSAMQNPASLGGAPPVGLPSGSENLPAQN